MIAKVFWVAPSEANRQTLRLGLWRIYLICQIFKKIETIKINVLIHFENFELQGSLSFWAKYLAPPFWHGFGLAF